jgi:hypothetical protein
MGHKFIPDQIDYQVGWQCSESRSIRVYLIQMALRTEREDHLMRQGAIRKSRLL